MEHRNRYPQADADRRCPSRSGWTQSTSPKLATSPDRRTFYRKTKEGVEVTLDFGDLLKVPKFRPHERNLGRIHCHFAWNLLENPCCCSHNYNADEFWIGCDICERWFHGKCVKITPAKAENIKQYKCASCSLKRGRQ